MKLNVVNVSGFAAFVSGLLGSTEVYANNDIVAVQAAVAPTLPGLLAPLMPVIVAAVVGGSVSFGAWLIKTLLGMSIEAFCTFGETWADAKLVAALSNKDPNDDIPAMAFTKAVKAMCTRLRASEKSIPGKDN